MTPFARPHLPTPPAPNPARSHSWTDGKARSDLDKQYAGRMEETTVLQKKLFAAQLAEAAHGRAAEEAKAKARNGDERREGEGRRVVRFAALLFFQETRPK